jgi:hypothetical protein
MSRWVTPNEMLAAAKEHQLQGREPTSHEDWIAVLNFAAHNMGGPEELTILQLKLFRRLYAIPVSEELTTKIAQFQFAQNKETVS